MEILARQSRQRYLSESQTMGLQTMQHLYKADASSMSMVHQLLIFSEALNGDGPPTEKTGGNRTFKIIPGTRNGAVNKPTFRPFPTRTANFKVISP